MFTLRSAAAAAALAMTVTAAPTPWAIGFNDKKGRVEVQAHRGGLGMRSEESLWVGLFPIAWQAMGIIVAMMS